MVADPELYGKLFTDTANVAFSVTTGNYAIPYLKAGIGYGFVVKSYVLKALETGELLEAQILDHEPLFLQSYLIYKTANPAVSSAFLEHIQSYLQNNFARTS